MTELARAPPVGLVHWWKPLKADYSSMHIIFLPTGQIFPLFWRC